MKAKFIILGFLLVSGAANALAELVTEASQTEAVKKPVCDPVVTVNENNKSRFEILKSLADTHGFTVTLLESEDSTISLEKTDKLSRVVESITRGTSVVLRYKTIENCEILTEIAFLDNKAWEGTGGGVSEAASARGEGVRNYQARLIPRQVSEEELASEEMQQTDEQKERFEERRQARILAQERQEELRKQRMESSGLEYQPAETLNETLEGGENLKAVYRAGRPDWRSSQSSNVNVENPENEEEGSNEDKQEQVQNGLGIEDMDAYVREVLAGTRVPDTGSMNAKERFEYMKARQRIRNE